MIFWGISEAVGVRTARGLLLALLAAGGRQAWEVAVSTYVLTIGKSQSICKGNSE